MEIKDTRFFTLGKDGIHQMYKKYPSCNSNEIPVEITFKFNDDMFKKPILRGVITVDTNKPIELDLEPIEKEINRLKNQKNNK